MRRTLIIDRIIALDTQLDQMDEQRKFVNKCYREIKAEKLKLKNSLKPKKAVSNA